MKTDHPGAVQLEQGRLLREHGRHEQALDLFREAVANDPENSQAHAEIALCLLQIEDRAPEALLAIDRAISLEPDIAHYKAIKALVLVVLGKAKEALGWADQAIASDAGEAFFFRVKGQAYLSLSRWKEAEAELKQALHLDPDDQVSANLLANALRVQNKLWESDVTVERLLAADPENELAHHNAGWSALQKNDYAKAEMHFREALRINPNCDDARRSLLQSFRARSAFFRVYLQYAFFMQRFTTGARWAIVIGLYLGFKFGRTLLYAVHPVLAAILTVVYLLLVFWVWLAEGIGNFIILLDRSARVSLKRREKLLGVFVGGGLLLGILMLLAFTVTPEAVPLIAGMCVVASAVPFSMTFTNKVRLGRILFGAMGFTALIIGLSIPVLSLVTKPGLGLGLGFLGLLGCLISTWLGNIGSLNKQ